MDFVRIFIGCRLVVNLFEMVVYVFVLFVVIIFVVLFVEFVLNIFMFFKYVVVNVLYCLNVCGWEYSFFM